MSDEIEPHVSEIEAGRGDPEPASFLIRALERITGLVLLLVLAVVGWLTLAAYRPEWGRVGRLEAEVAAVVALLAVALALVSLLALVHTRR